MNRFFLRWAAGAVLGVCAGALYAAAPTTPQSPITQETPVSAAAPITGLMSAAQVSSHTQVAALSGKQAMDTLYRNLTEKGQTRILFRESCVVRGANYTLGDLADIECVDYEKGMRLAELELGKSPAIGLRTTLNPASLRQRLASLGALDEAVLVLPKRMTLERESQQIEPTQIEQAVRDTLLQNAGLQAERIVAEEFRIPPTATVPAGELTLRIELRLPRKGGGTASFSAIPMVDGVSQRTLYGSFRLDYQVDVLQLAAPVEAGQIIPEDAVVTGQMRASEVEGKAVREDQLKSGLRAREPMEPGEPLTWEAVAREELVRRGQPVQIVAEKGLMRIAAKGKALASGSLGDEVAVENTQSRKRLQGTVIGPGEVSVAF